MKRLLIGVAVLLVVLVAAGAALWVFYQRALEPYKGFAGAEQFVEIPAGSTTPAIGRRLVEARVIRDEWAFRIAIWNSETARRLKAGEYRFDAALTPREVLAKLARGDVFVRPITFREGLTIVEMARVFEEHGLGTAAEFLAAARDAAPIQAIDPAARDLEGYLFPETYLLPRHTTAARLVGLMVDRFLQAFDPPRRALAQSRGLTLRQAVTLASIVEKETGNAAERAVVAAVYSNRLRIGMALQCDPTVIYALQVAGTYAGNLRRDDLQVDSPYNTYRYPGLPPGPIASPGQASIDAALHPADADVLYFVSRNDGTHAFARTLPEHNRNVQKYQVEYFRERRQPPHGH